eukprot:CAMPEP_0184665188 /NCGR_PEP_ID=MMETSP0308-20130426/56090_1 /TAXON_ID=38269 /ORGANISM="Gloeochaete witrockiana, Strain SAG 46.84" /LENGTH=121 /DNA_ID=CAMNT_0027109023 /DNA_START=346 /DNA_END=711 /DNA_ORIENTATION=-
MLSDRGPWAGGDLKVTEEKLLWRLCAGVTEEERRVYEERMWEGDLRLLIARAGGLRLLRVLSVVFCLIELRCDWRTDGARYMRGWRTETTTDTCTVEPMSMEGRGGASLCMVLKASKKRER